MSQMRSYGTSYLKNKKNTMCSILYRNYIYTNELTQILHGFPFLPCIDIYNEKKNLQCDMKIFFEAKNQHTFELTNFETTHV